MKLNWKDGKAVCGELYIYVNNYGLFYRWDIETGRNDTLRAGRADSEPEAQEAAETALQSIIDPAFWSLHKGDVEKAAEAIEEESRCVDKNGNHRCVIHAYEAAAIIAKHLGGE